MESRVILCEDILYHIFLHVCPTKMAICEGVCRTWKNFIQHPMVWISIIRKYTPGYFSTKSMTVTKWQVETCQQMMKNQINKIFSVLKFNTDEEKFRSIFTAVVYNEMVRRVNSHINMLTPDKSFMKLFYYPLDDKIENSVNKSQMDDLLKDFNEVKEMVMKEISETDSAECNNIINLLGYMKLFLTSAHRSVQKADMYVIASFFDV